MNQKSSVIQILKSVPGVLTLDNVKFIRMSESLIEKNGEGVLGFITNHGYLDNPTFRGMRWHLMQTFDKIYVLDLHGNAKKNEVTPESNPDKNVFDIQQGVAIIIAVKKKDVAGPARIFHGDLWGSREGKYTQLLKLEHRDNRFKEIQATLPQMAFVPRDHNLLDQYGNGFKFSEFVCDSGVGMVTARDNFTIDENKEAIWRRAEEFSTLEVETARTKFALGKDVQSWKVNWAQEDVRQNLDRDLIVPTQYRPFDSRWTFYTGKSGGFICRPCRKIMRHVIGKENIAICVSKQQKTNNGFHHVLIHSDLIESSYVSNKTGEIGYSFPLYLYPDEQDLDQTRRVNFDPKLWKKLQKLATHKTHGTPDEVETFDYIYGVLHCPAYRDTYAEFLKIDFPRIPWPASPDEFWDISTKGAALRKLHLMDTATIGDTPFQYIGDGDDIVHKPRFDDGKVWINATQYFDAAPPVSWDFFIGGYQPAQKWLKDRKGRELSFDDIRHYQRILKILSETDRIMRTITMTLNPKSTK